MLSRRRRVSHLLKRKVYFCCIPWNNEAIRRTSKPNPISLSVLCVCLSFSVSLVCLSLSLSLSLFRLVPISLFPPPSTACPVLCLSLCPSLCFLSPPPDCFFVLPVAGVGAGEMAPDSSSRWAAAQAKVGPGGGGAASASGSGLATPAKKVPSYGGGRYQRGSSASDGERERHLAEGKHNLARGEGHAYQRILGTRLYVRFL